MGPQDTTLSRSGVANPDGKLISRFDVPVTEKMHAEVVALATIEGTPPAEWIRNLIFREVHGRLAMVRRMVQQGASCPSDESRTHQG